MSDSGSTPKTTEIIPLDPLHGLADNGAETPALFLQQARASERFFDFFTSNIRNKHTRRAYYNAACRFSEFCTERGVHDLAQVKPVHVAGCVESLLPALPSLLLSDTSLRYACSSTGSWWAMSLT